MLCVWPLLSARHAASAPSWVVLEKALNADHTVTLAALNRSERNPCRVRFRCAEGLDLQKRAVTFYAHDNGLRLKLAKIAVTAGESGPAGKELQALEAVGASVPLKDEATKLLTSL